MSPLCSLPCEDPRGSRQPGTGLSPESDRTGAPISLPAPRTLRSKCLWLKSHPGRGAVLRQPGPTRALPRVHTQGYEETPAGTHCVPQTPPLAHTRLPLPLPGLCRPSSLRVCAVAAPIPGPWVRRAAFAHHGVIDSGLLLGVGKQQAAGAPGWREGRCIYSSSSPHPACYSQIQFRQLSGQHPRRAEGRLSVTYSFGSSYFKSY